ncbi:hypothetical protein GGI07_001775 [Coemansia sp. Benny D115]|nr:hypothetical protein GGI07_001775 [Coemansia sp. Benny D115]
MPGVGTTVAAVREEQRARVMQLGGRVLKFTNNGGKLYFRYYFPHPSTLNWNKLTSGLRVLFSIAKTDLYIRYTDVDGTKITVNDDSGLRIMFDETKSSDVIRIDVVTDDNPPTSLNSSIPGMDGPDSMGIPATMTMPMPAPGFPGMEPSRPGSALSIPNTTATAPRPPPMQQQPSMANPPNMSQPGPVPQNIPTSFTTGGPVPAGPQSVYGRVNNSSMATMPPPEPQHPQP